MKGYCECGNIIDEVEFTQFGMCEGCYKKDSGGNEPCPICFGDKLDDLNQIEDEDKRYHAIQDFINELLSSGGEKCSDIELEKKEYILPSF